MRFLFLSSVAHNNQAYKQTFTRPDFQITKPARKTIISAYITNMPSLQTNTTMSTSKLTSVHTTLPCLHTTLCIKHTYYILHYHACKQPYQDCTQHQSYTPNYQACTPHTKHKHHTTKGPFIYRAIQFWERGGQPFYRTATAEKGGGFKD